MEPDGKTRVWEDIQGDHLDELGLVQVYPQWRIEEDRPIDGAEREQIISEADVICKLHCEDGQRPGPRRIYWADIEYVNSGQAHRAELKSWLPSRLFWEFYPTLVTESESQLATRGLTIIVQYEVS